MTLLLFNFLHRSLVTVHTDFYFHTASGCLCRSRPLQWCYCTCHGFLDVRKRVKEAPCQVGFHFWEQKLISRCKIWRIWRVVEHSHFSLGQKLLDNCRVVGRSVVQRNQSPDSHMPGLSRQILFRSLSITPL